MEIVVGNKGKNDDRYLKAKKRFEKVKAFYVHLLIYFSIILTIVFINFKLTPEDHWFWYSVIGAGIPLLIHGLKVFLYNAKWEERKTKDILEKEDDKQK